MRYFQGHHELRPPDVEGCAKMDNETKVIKGSEVRKADHQIKQILLECRENPTPLSIGTGLGKLSGLELFVTV